MYFVAKIQGPMNRQYDHSGELPLYLKTSEEILSYVQEKAYEGNDLASEESWEDFVEYYEVNIMVFTDKPVMVI